MSETIAAISTAPGEGGIGIVRISGDSAAHILSEIFISKKEKPGEVIDFVDRQFYYGHIIEPSSMETIDEVLVVLMKGPHSYTGEDVVEIQCHGGVVPLGRILGATYKNGAIPATPGEFTKRAFLNGRIDLVQAGAVIDLIKAKTDKSYNAARIQTEGYLSKQIENIRNTLLLVLAQMTARIDYPEAFDDVDGDEEYLTFLSSAREMVSSLIESAETGKIVREGLRTVIIGKPNAGKSSLFNAFTREDTAIVTNIAGTTRDALEVMINIHGIPVILTDTAGIRKADGQIEALGIEKSKEAYDRADLAIFVLDGSEQIEDEDREIASGLSLEKRTLVVINKCDKKQIIDGESAKNLVPFDVEVLRSSALEMDSIVMLEKKIADLVFAGNASASSNLLITKETHKALLENALMDINDAIATLDRGDAAEFAEVNIKAAYETLGEILGETVTEDILDKVFEEFCIGK